MSTGYFLLVALLACLRGAAAASAHEDSSGDDAVRALMTRPDFRKAITDSWRRLPNLLRDLGPDDACVDDFYKDTIAMAHMIDASAKDPTGLLAASWIHLGNWDECVGARDDAKSFQGQMCMLNIGAKPVDARRTRAMALAREETIGSMIQSVSLKMAACMPSTCSPETVQKFYWTVFKDALLGFDYNLTLTVDPAECTVEEKPGFDAVDWVALAIFILLGLAVVASTAADVLIPNRQPLLAAFSVYTNGKKLLKVSSGGDGAISCLHGIRFLSMCWVVLGHRYSMSMSLANINPGYMLDFMNNIWRIGITNATVSVDTFFVISGLLVGYLFFKQMRVSRKFSFPMYYIHRYIRLTPALAFMVLMNSSLLMRMGWGPLWESSLASSRDLCQKNWWNVLIYVNNYVAPMEGCIGQSWYLMVDMQLYWLSPLLLFPMLFWPKLAFAAVALLCAGGLACCFAISYVNDLPANFLTISDLDKMMVFFKNFYVPAYTRFVPYLIGLVLGYALADIKVKAKKVRFSMPVTLLLWLTAAALMLVPLFTGYVFIHGDPPTKLATAFYNAFYRALWSAGVAVVVFLCATGHGCLVNPLLSWKGFQLLGRLSYCVFLVHMSVQNVEGASIRTNSFMSDVVILPAFAGDLLISFLLAAVLSLVTESPFLVMEKELLKLGGGRRGGPAPSAPASSPVDGAVPKQNSAEGLV